MNEDQTRSSFVPANGQAQRRVQAHLVSMPKIRRLSMVPNVIERNPFGRFWTRMRVGKKAGNASAKNGVASACAVAATEKPSWRQAARSRRTALMILIAVQTLAASWSLTNTFPYPWLKGSEVAIVGMFAILFSWISFGFWTAVAGFWILWTRVKDFSVVDLLECTEDQQPLQSRSAVLMPICNENVERVFAGLEATYRSLAATSELRHFDFYVLSDTNDPERQVEEEIAWAETCRAVQGFGQIFYRHRRNNIRRKSGNIADFLRRWGRNYEYMVVFDADSVIAGDTLVRLTRMMDLHPQAGIIQTAPATVNCESLFGRVQQFASRAYGPMLTAGLRFWQLGENFYWGHNAIVRVAPFIENCGLARLPGKPPLGGEILSHDFVEAALMGRAGWEVWVVHDLPGSYEESPPSLLDELKRDRRWCQGNLQHMRLFLGDRIRGGHRAMFATGIMAYASALLWLVFLVLNTIEIAMESLLPPIYFPTGPSLFPIWPKWQPEWTVGLLGTTAVMLFLPKFLALSLIIRNRKARLFGGVVPLGLSTVLEIFLSSLLAPIRMWFHSNFVLVTLMGKQIKWSSQCRTDNAIAWPEAIRVHGFSTLLGLGWIAGVWKLNPAASVWLLPVAIPLVLSIPLSVYSSRIGLGRAARRWRLFVIPEEIHPPQVIKYLLAGVQERSRQKSQADVFERVVADPEANAIHVGLLRGKVPRSTGARARNKSLQEKALRQGPASLTRSERAHLLRDAETMAALHHDLCQINLGTQSPLAQTRRPILPALRRPQHSEPHDHAADGARPLSNSEAHWQAI
jgi:membrane glycosyltransferase